MDLSSATPPPIPLSPRQKSKSAAATVPSPKQKMATVAIPIPTSKHHHRQEQQQQHSRSRHSARNSTSRRQQQLAPDDPSRRRSAPAQTLTPTSTAASPEVINSLVEQLSKLSPSPLHNPFLYGSLATPDHRQQRHEMAELFPNSGGVVSETKETGFLHPDEAAMAPVVRTSKPPSGFSSHTKNDSISHSRRSSNISGSSGGNVGTKGGVDIPSYVRTYMNRVPDHGRDESPNGRLNYHSSKERLGKEKAGGKEIPERSSSYNKGSNPSAPPFPDAILTNHPPLYKPPTNSPGFPPSYFSEDDGDRSAPAPELTRNRNRDSDHRNSKRSSKGHPKRAESLPGRHCSSRDGKGSSPTRKKRASGSKRVSDSRVVIQQTTTTTTSSASMTSAARPSFQSLSTDHDRPGSADSIDDAVEAYLCSPRLSQKIRMPATSRTISFSEVGDPEGFAVFVCVGMGLTRYVTAFYDELALTLGLRLITPDRPGVGESDPIDENERAVLNWPDDVLYICQALKITKFSILAHSAGAIYALATALRMPGHIRGKIHLLAPWIPPSQMESVVQNGDNKGEKAGSIPTSQRILRALPTPILKAANSSFMSATSSSLTTSLPRTSARKNKQRKSANPSVTTAKDLSSAKDRPTLTTNHLFESSPPDVGEDTPESVEAALLRTELAAKAEKERQSSYDERLTCAIWGLSTRNANPAVDLLVCLERNRPVGFRYVDIVRDVVIHHGARDTRVPVENVKWLGKTMRTCEVRVLPGEGHGLMASAQVMGGVLDEIAGEWRDWKKVVEKRRMAGVPTERERAGGPRWGQEV